MADDVHFLPAFELAGRIAAGQLSSVEAVRAAIARIEALDGAVNAVPIRDFERAEAAAAKADAALAAGERRALTGVPVLVKDSFDVAGLPTTWGMPWAADWRAESDSLAVRRLKAAGAVVLGKTNVPPGLGDWQSHNPIHGTTSNPWDLDRTPGGSSGGSSAALAAGFSPLALGSDIGGSLRAPAHVCGVFAHKPTHGLLPMRGHTPPGLPRLPGEMDLAVIGPMARSATDLMTALDILAGPDELVEGVAYRLALPPPRHERLADFRVLVLDLSSVLPASAAVSGALDSLADRLDAVGAKVSRSSRLTPDLGAMARCYMHALTAFLVASGPPEMHERAVARAARIAPDDDSLAAARARGGALSHRDWLAALAARRAFAGQWRALSEEFDVVIKAPMPTPAFPHDHSEPQEKRRLDIDGAAYPYVDQLAYPGIATLIGLPATAAPLGLTDDGLPVGVEIVGPCLEDRTPIRFAELLERGFGGFVPPPGY